MPSSVACKGLATWHVFTLAVLIAYSMHCIWFQSSFISNNLSQCTANRTLHGSLCQASPHCCATQCKIFSLFDLGISAFHLVIPPYCLALAELRNALWLGRQQNVAQSQQWLGRTALGSTPACCYCIRCKRSKFLNHWHYTQEQQPGCNALHQ